MAIVTENSLLIGRAVEPDTDLVEHVKCGDIPAYSELVNRHQGAVYGIVSRMVNCRDDVDDLVQDVFVTAYRSIGSFRGQAAFSTWLHTIAVNTAIKHLRKSKIRQTMPIEDMDMIADTATDTSEQKLPIDAAQESERKLAVQKAVDRLPEKHRTVVILHYFEDYSCEEIAKTLNCSVGTVWSRLHYACKKLRGQLDWLETA
ncbi:MAG: sigma-70 family RNA polymerase sigma factor [Armatimonadota bacterium]